MKVSPKKNSASVSVALLALAGFTFTYAGDANAILSSCVDDDDDWDISEQVTPNKGCKISDETQDSVTEPMTVNTEEFFDFDDWIFDGKWQEPENESDPVFKDSDDPSQFITLDGDAAGGTWQTTGEWSWADMEDLMFIFKDGNATSLVGYWIEDNATSGHYATPYLNPPFDVSGDETTFSHLSVYYREGGGTEVPTPGVLWLLGLGMIGLHWTIRRVADTNR